MSRITVSILLEYPRTYLQSVSCGPGRLLTSKAHVFQNTRTYKQICFCEKFTWNPAESLVCDASRQLNVLHQAASCFTKCTHLQTHYIDICIAIS
ncbi:hypothetical protein CSKR_100978 [Clonorchis sinensis]|uniref:Uncharacterized protein n=1 Tax=Clonorchis sinensis TaxID=79923 RepID=A0A3R7H512_CLOSI|nr:hypothetical protein CSKR_100978 [Clonorchis sinensis]